jgi:hypothetical protein
MMIEEGPPQIEHSERLTLIARSVNSHARYIYMKGIEVAKQGPMTFNLRLWGRTYRGISPHLSESQLPAADFRGFHNQKPVFLLYSSLGFQVLTMIENVRIGDIPRTSNRSRIITPFIIPTELFPWGAQDSFYLGGLFTHEFVSGDCSSISLSIGSRRISYNDRRSIQDRLRERCFTPRLFWQPPSLKRGIYPADLNVLDTREFENPNPHFLPYQLLYQQHEILSLLDKLSSRE